MSVILQTGRLIIREFLPEEMEDYLQHFTDDRVTVHLPERSREERITLFNNALKNYTITKTSGIWGMYDKSNGIFAGSCLLRPFDDEEGALELGYSLEPACWGKGLATEMAKAVIEYGLSHDGVKAIVAVTTLQNLASQRVLTKAGLRRADDIRRGNLVLALFRLPD